MEIVIGIVVGYLTLGFIIGLYFIVQEMRKGGLIDGVVSGFLRLIFFMIIWLPGAIVFLIKGQNKIR